MMKLSLIVAMDKNRVIGVNNTLPWRLSGDLQRFKKLTLGKTIIMGRKTYDSIGKALPSRYNIIVSRNSELMLPDAAIAPSLEAAIAQHSTQDEIMIIGGASLYEQAISMVDKMYLTLVDVALHGDSYFPAWQPQEWREVFRELHHADQKNEYNYTFVDLEKI